MGKRRTVRKPVIYYGKKAGTKKSDRHWLDPEGNKWDSRYEYIVYRTYAEAGRQIRRTDKSDTVAFILPIKGGKCGACGSVEVGQQRTYTPDLFAHTDNPKHKALGYYIEAKGYLRAKERALLRNLYKAHPDAAIRILLNRDYPVGAVSKVTGTRSSIVKWFAKFLPNYKVELWNGKIPTGW